MIVRLAIPAAFCALALTPAFAQTAETPKPAPAQAEKPAAEEKKPPETPPDLKAYRDALKETDPEKEDRRPRKVEERFPREPDAVERR